MSLSDLDISNLDDETLYDIINQYNTPKNVEDLDEESLRQLINNCVKQEDDCNILHEAAYEMAINNIPEMFIPSGMIILRGYINDVPLKIMLDTGASTSIIFKNAIDKTGLQDLIDKREKSELRGIGNEMSPGRIWYVPDFRLANLLCPISLVVSNNVIRDFDMILGINFLQTYKAIINFKNKTLQLNEKYDITFNYE